MGWVKDRLTNYPQFTPKLWDELKDSIGVAVMEFNDSTSNAADNHLEAKDCTSMGKYCRRVSKAYGAVSVEVFLDEATKMLKIAPDVSICGYRIRPDRAAAEFFKDTPEGPFGIPVEEACRMAIEEFIFKPLSKPSA
jgi:hypothetical protein